MKKIFVFLFISVTLVIVFLISIKNLENTKTEGIDIYRFEQSLFTTNASEVDKDILEWQKMMGPFFDSFNYRILRTNLDDVNYKQELLQFILYPDMREAFDTLTREYPDLDFLEKDFALAFTKYKRYFPEKKVPTIITYFSGFNFGVVTNDTIVAIGLDYFLGKDCSFYKRLNFPEYLRRKNQKKFILPYCFEAIANNEFSIFCRENDFLSQMIYKGKIMYFMDLMLPKVSESDKLRFSKTEITWCQKNEKSIWAYFIDNEILYSSDIKKFNSYINSAPFARGMPKESPGRIAYYIGWKIVDEYMENNPKLTLNKLMENTKSQEILQQSGYKP